MSSDSASTSRALMIIDFLAANSLDSFNLSQISKQLGLSHATAHRVLSTLLAARYVSRHPKHKTYALGVALVGVGQAALERHHVIDVARREMVRLSEELNIACTASVAMDDEMLILAKHGTPQTPPGITRVGDRRPFVPPVGIANIAWAEPKIVEEYLSRAPADLSPEVQLRLRQALRLVRERGYSIVANGPGIFGWQNTATDLSHRRDETYWDQVHALVRRLTPDEVQLANLSDALPKGVGYITAPVFSPTGDVALELAIGGLPRDLTVEEIERYAARLRAATAVVMSENQGRIPVSRNQIG